MYRFEQAKKKYNVILYCIYTVVYTVYKNGMSTPMAAALGQRWVVSFLLQRVSRSDGEHMRYGEERGERREERRERGIGHASEREREGETHFGGRQQKTRHKQDTERTFCTVPRVCCVWCVAVENMADGWWQIGYKKGTGGQPMGRRGKSQ
jgi:hypothetical protein